MDGQVGTPDGLIPFCDICGDPRVMASGTHRTDEHLVRWAMYACGHTRTRLALEEAPAAPVR